MILRELRADDLVGIAAVDGGPAWKPDPALWTDYVADQSAGRRVVLIAEEQSSVLAYGTLLWESRYLFFSAAGVAEISNLVVAQHARRRGIATAMIGTFEQYARQRGRKFIGLGVGLYADYGPAQRLYVKLGYRPDGSGITYADEPVPAGQTVRLDDRLVLCFHETFVCRMNRPGYWRASPIPAGQEWLALIFLKI